MILTDTTIIYHHSKLSNISKYAFRIIDFFFRKILVSRKDKTMSKNTVINALIRKKITFCDSYQAAENVILYRRVFNFNN